LQADPEDLRALQQSIEEMNNNEFQARETDDLIIDNDFEESLISF